MGGNILNYRGNLIQFGHSVQKKIIFKQQPQYMSIQQTSECDCGWIVLIHLHKTNT